jgi:hypothetical protein
MARSGALALDLLSEGAMARRTTRAMACSETCNALHPDSDIGVGEWGPTTTEACLGGEPRPPLRPGGRSGPTDMLA